MKYTNPSKKPKIISVRRADESIEDEAPIPAPPMATPMPEKAPLIILIRPSWIDMPMKKLAWAFTRATLAVLPALLIISLIWRISHDYFL